MALKRMTALVTLSLTLVISAVGCAGKTCEPCASVDPPAPLGTLSDPIWELQETNGEASNDFVIREHEFIGNTPRLNARGEDHVKQIAVRLNNTPFPVMVEPSSMTTREGDRYDYAVHNDPELDLKRRDLVVQALETMGVTDADQRVVVSPDITPGFQYFEAQRAYSFGFGGFGNNGGGFGGGGFGGGGF